MLDTLKTLPEHKRKQLAFGVALGVSLIVFSFWVSSLSEMFAPPASELVEDTAKEPSLTASLIQSFSHFFDFVGEKVGDVTERLEVGI